MRFYFSIILALASFSSFSQKKISWPVLELIQVSTSMDTISQILEERKFEFDSNEQVTNDNIIYIKTYFIKRAKTPLAQEAVIIYRQKDSLYNSGVEYVTSDKLIFNEWKATCIHYPQLYKKIYDNSEDGCLITVYESSSFRKVFKDCASNSKHLYRITFQ